MNNSGKICGWCGQFHDAPGSCNNGPFPAGDFTSSPPESKTPETEFDFVPVSRTLEVILKSKATLNYHGSVYYSKDTVAEVVNETSRSLELRLKEALAKVEQTKDQVDLFESIVDGARHYLKATEQESVQSAAFRVAKERDEALAKLAEATNDKERIDWLDSAPLTVVHFKPQNDDPTRLRIYCDAGMIYGINIRSAIDAAMKASS